MVIWGQLLDYIGAMITIAAFFYGPVMGIMFVDYFFIRKRKVSLRAVYELEGHDCYKYTKGFNVVAFGCAIIGIIGDLLFSIQLDMCPKARPLILQHVHFLDLYLQRFYSLLRIRSWQSRSI